MKNSLSSDDRRHVRTSLIASLAFVATFLSGSFAWAGVNAPAVRTPSLKAAPAATAVAEQTSPDEGDLGCGCAEACLVAN